MTTGTGQSAVTWGTIALNTATGVWTFTANAAALDGLGAGQTETLALTAQVTDADGDTDTEAFTITLNGVDEAASTNTAPTLAGAGAGDLAGAVTEDASPNTATGTLNFADADTDDTAASLIFSTGKAEVWRRRMKPRAMMRRLIPRRIRRRRGRRLLM